MRRDLRLFIAIYIYSIQFEGLYGSNNLGGLRDVNKAFVRSPHHDLVDRTLRLLKTLVRFSLSFINQHQGSDVIVLLANPIFNLLLGDSASMIDKESALKFTSKR